MKSFVNTMKDMYSMVRIEKKAVIVLIVILFNCSQLFSQAVGDYRSNNTGNWSTLNTWQRWDGDSWETPTVGQGYPGELSSPSEVTIRNLAANSTITLNVSPTNSIGSITISGGNRYSYLTFSGTNSLTVTNNIFIGAGTGTGDHKIIAVGAGSLTCGGSVNVTATTNANRNSGITLSTGTVTVTGNIAMNDANDVFTFTGAGLLNVGGDMSGGTFTSSTGTVNYNNTTAQNVGGYTYYNLTMSNGGTKTMTGNVTVNNVLALDNGNLSLGSSNYNLTIGNAGAITGAFDNTRMIVCDGTGSLIKQDNTIADFIMTYPVGTNSFYTPMEVTALSASGTGSISVRAVAGEAPGPPAVNSTDLQRYWDVNVTGITVTSVDASFTYDDSDVGTGGDETTYSPKYYNGSSWTDPAGASINTITNVFSTSGSASLAGQWTAREPFQTYYSYQSGNWALASTWTLDPSGTIYTNPGSQIPGTADRVVVLNGRTVNISADNDTVYSLQLNEGGILTIGTTTGHDFGTVSGQGKLILASTTFPDGTYTDFVSAGGGTVEMQNATDFSFTTYTYNNLIINLSASGDVATYNTSATPLVINGDLTVERGTFRINDNSSTAKLTITIYGNVTVESSGNISLGTGANSRANAHDIFIGGDLTNNGGDVRFTNLDATDMPGCFTSDAGDGITNVIFNNATKDQNLVADGITYFNRLEINKGSDKTYILNIDASAGGNFAYFGRSNFMDWGTFATNENALGLEVGTCRLGPGINIPCMVGAFYHIFETAALWIDGATVNFKNFSTGTWPSQTNSGLYIYGELKVYGGGSMVLDGNAYRGIVLRGAPVVEIEDATLSASMIRTSANGAVNRGAFIMNEGANVTFTGNTYDNRFATFSFGFPNNVVNISGGTLNIQNPTTSGGGIGSLFSVQVASLPGNISITGGTINLTIPGGSNAYIASTMPFWNLNLIGSNIARNASVRKYNNPVTGPDDPVTITPLPLIVKHDLTLNSLAVLNTANTNDADTPFVNLQVGGNFTLPSGSIYTPGANNTIFDGSGTQSFEASGAITGNLEDLTLTNAADLTLLGNNITVDGDFAIDDSCTLRDNGRIVYVLGDITNSGLHYRPVSGAGSIQLTGTAAQTISGNGTGIFNNLTLNKTGGSVIMTSDMTITGNLRLAGSAGAPSRLNINSQNLLLGSDARVYSDLAPGTGTAFSINRMIQTGGLMSDKGVSKTYSNTTAFNFPFGFYNAANSTYYYMPHSIQFSSAPTTYGTVTSRPVNARHPLTQTTNSLACYWKTTSTGFLGIPSGTVRHRYYYDHAGTNYFVSGDEDDYIPAVYRGNSTWIVNDNLTLIDRGTNEVYYDTAVVADGEYTAGEMDAFVGLQVRYSAAGGDWDNTATWSSTGVGGPGGASVPGPNTLVIIGNASNNHTVTIGANGKQCGSLFISQGSTLDLQTYTGHDFAALPDKEITGGGTLRIASSNYFPQGDFGLFISENGGTVEYYNSGANIIVPTTSDVTGLTLDHYRNLILSQAGTYNIVLPNSDLTIYEDLNVAGDGVSQVRTDANATHAITVNGNVNINSGIFEIRNNQVQTIQIIGDLNINVGAQFRVQNGGTAVNHILELNRDLFCGGTFDMNVATGRAYTYFKGTTDGVIDGSGTIDFYNLFVDKGSDTTSSVTLLTTVTAGVNNPFLTLSNGTFRVNNSALTLTISNASTNFSIPYTACLSVIAGTVRVAYNSGGGAGNADLMLSGKLEVLGGNLVIGNTADNTNNDIEYASAGLPEVYVAGGQLIVNGQVRRSTTITSGSLNYGQSGGDVIVYGRNNQATRAKIEVTNDGSSFNISGGTLTVVRGGGTLYGDIYIRPENYSVTGGTLYIGNALSAGQNFNLSTSAPLWNLYIDTSAVGLVTELNVLPLTILNNLTINDNSEFHINGNDVTIGGNLTNSNTNAGSGVSTGGYQTGSTTQTTTFDGAGMQLISGSGANLTNFANLVINTTGTDTLASNTNIRVNGDLTLNSGRFADGGNIVTVIGDIENNATHSSSAGNGIVMAGTNRQTISGDGNGVFGNLTINNTNGVDMVDNSAINNTLTFTNGSLYINDYLLTLGTSASIGGSPDATKMIILNGVLSDLGVKKLFPSGPSAAFTYPVGVSGKYTPVTYTITATSASGTITVIPVNFMHPATLDASGNELAYYWSVKATGFSNPTITHRYQYLDSDVSGTESAYVIGQYDPVNYIWTNLGDNVVDEGSDWITLTDVDTITGEYTAGANPNFGILSILYSISATHGGNWFDGNTWSETSHGGTACGYAPNGNPVVIAVGDTVIVDANSALSSSIDLHGILNIGSTTFHNFGHVYGTGEMIIASSPDGMFVFPGGEYSDFLSTSSTIIEFTGDNDATLPLKPGNIYKPFQNVEFSGTGQKILSADDMKVLGDLTIFDGTVFNALYNRKIYIHGDWIDYNSTGSGGLVSGTGTVYFQGTAPQNIIVDDSVTTEQFYNLRINNSTGVTLGGNGQVNVSKYLYLTAGNIFTNTTNLLSISNTSTGAIIGGGSLSFVDGPLRKNIISTQSFYFPVGDGTRYGRFALLNTSVASSPQYWTVTYFDADPDPEDDDSLYIPISSISDNEYWVVNRPAGGTANIQLRWDANSYPGVTSDPLLRNRLRVIEFDDAAGWEERGETVSGNATSGTVRTTTPVTYDDYIFTLGVSGVTAAITATENDTICDNGEIASIPVSLTGMAPWTLSYRTIGDGGTPVNNFTQSGITSSSYTIQLTGTDMGGSASSPYTLSLTSVSDALASGVCNSNTIDIIVNTAYIPNITGSSAVGTGETRSYTTAYHAGSTYLWEWIGTTGGTINDDDSSSTNITFDAGIGTFQLQVTETYGGCSGSDIQIIEVSNVPAPDITPKTANICIGDVVEYSTFYNAGNEYLWTVTNGTCDGCGVYIADSASITVTWDATGSGSVSVREHVVGSGDPGVYGDTSQNYYVSAMPSMLTVTADSSDICLGDTTSIIVESSEAGINYLLCTVDGDTIGSPLSGNGSDRYLSTGGLALTTSYYVMAYNGGCDLRMPAAPDSVTVNVHDLPSGSLTSDDADNAICYGTSVIFTATPGDANYRFMIDGGEVQNSSSETYTTSTLNDLEEVTVEVTNAYGCLNTYAGITMTVHIVPDVNDIADQTVCDSYTLPVITGTGLTGGEAYYTGSGGTGTQYVSGNAITSSMTLYIYDETGTTPNCSDEESFTITVNITPDVDDIADQTVCDSYTLPVITGTGLTGGEAYYTGSERTGTQYVSGNAITSSMTLYIYDETGTTPNCSDEESFTVTVSTTPIIAEIIGDTMVSCKATGIPYSIPFNIGSTYQWYAHDSIIFVGSSDTSSVVVDFGDLDEVWISVVETNAYGCQDSIAMQIVQTGCGLKADFMSLDTVICAGDTVHFIDLSSNVTSATQYMWVFGEGIGDTVIYTGHSDTSFVYLTAGEKTVELWLDEGAIDSLIRTDYITVYPTTEITSQPVDSIIECVGTPVSFSLSAVGEGLTYDWQKFNGSDWDAVTIDGNLTIVNDTTVNITADTSSYSGLYRCEVTGYCNTVISDTVYVLFHELPEPVLIVSDDSICVGDTVVFIASGGDDYIFYLNGNPFSTGDSTYITDTLANGDQLYVEVIDTNTSCSNNSDIITMAVFDLPINIVLTADDTTVCAGTQVKFEVTATNASSFDFYVNDVLAQSGTNSIYITDSLISGDTVYTVVGNSHSCMDISTSIIVTVNDVPVVLLINDTIIGTCTNNLHLMDVAIVTLPPAKFTWLPNDGSLDTSIISDAILVNPVVGTITTYHVTVKDANECSGTDSVTIEVMPEIIFTNVTTQDVFCNADSNGAIDIKVTGGSGSEDFSYTWSVISGAGINISDEDQTGLASGDYLVVVTDNETGCTIDSIITIYETNPLIANAYVSAFYRNGWHLSYTGASDGEATVDVSGGLAPYTYLWSNYQTDSVIDSLASGNYSVRVEDEYGCWAVDTVTILEPDGFNVNIFEMKGISCYGVEDGILQARAFNEAGNVTYQWNYEDYIGQTLSGVGEGLYIVTATDDVSGDVDVDTFYLVSPGEIYVNIYIVDPISCHGSYDGTLQAVVDSGGTPGYNYTWGDGTEFYRFYNVSDGTYTVVATDANGCKGYDTVTISSPELLVSEYLIIDSKCYGEASGEIHTIVTGGVGSYAYEWSDSLGENINTLNWQDSVLSDIYAGKYIVRIVDGNNCEVIDTLVVNQADSIGIELVWVDPFCFSTQNGLISAIVTGGTPPYHNYEWNTEQYGYIISDLDTGFYKITVMDSNNCKSSDSIRLAYQSEICLEAATGFTPDGDGSNDYWEIKGAQYYPDIVVEVYDRWGRLVFKAENGYNHETEDPDYCWNGESRKGKSLPMDSYFYVIYPNDGSPVLTGSVTIIR